MNSDVELAVTSTQAVLLHSPWGHIIYCPAVPAE